MHPDIGPLDEATKGYVALVTGATGSLGREIVKRLGETGRYSRIYACFNTRDNIANQLKAMPYVEVCQLDLLTRRLDILPDKVDVLINNAALPASKALSTELSEDEFNKLLELNTHIPMLLAQRYLPGMIGSKWGRIINVNSIWGIRGSERNLAYTMSKRALSGLTQTIAIEFCSTGVTCNEVCPGPIDSEMMDRIFEARSMESGRGACALKHEFVSSLRAGRMVRVEEVAATIAFLTSPEASGINGVSLPIDLGFIV